MGGKAFGRKRIFYDKFIQKVGQRMRVRVRTDSFIKFIAHCLPIIIMASPLKGIFSLRI